MTSAQACYVPDMFYQGSILAATTFWATGRRGIRGLLCYHLTYASTLSSTSLTRLYFAIIRRNVYPKNLHRFSKAFLPCFDKPSLELFFFASCDCSRSLGLQF
jgi:hypothetical protein